MVAVNHRQYYVAMHVPVNGTTTVATTVATTVTTTGTTTVATTGTTPVATTGTTTANIFAGKHFSVLYFAIKVMSLLLLQLLLCICCSC